MDFSTLTLESTLEILTANQQPWQLTNLKFYDGDHWQDGDGWVGPRPDSTDPGSATVMSEIERAFVSQNTIREVVDRQAAGVAGREPSWRFVPREGDENPDDPVSAELGNMLTSWWDDRDALLELEKALRYALIGQRGLIRVYIPPTERDASGNIPTEDFFTSLDKIYIHAITPSQGLVWVDPSTMQKLSIFVYQEGDDTFAEISYYDRVTKETIWRVLGKDGVVQIDGVPQETRLLLGGRLMLGQITMEPIITASVRQNQQQLNKARTMMGRNTDLGGFLERVILNGKMPGDYITNPDGTETFVEMPMKVGPGTVNYIVGEEFTDSEGKKQVLSPSVIYRDPVDPSSFTLTIHESYLAILREVRQLHATITGDAAIGAESRRQALADYVNLLIKSKAVVDSLGRWLLSIVVDLASQFSGTSARYDPYRTEFNAQLYSGPVSADELRIVLEMVAAELISVESGMVRVGVEDPDAEKLTIQAEKDAKSSQVRGAGAAILENLDDGEEDV